MVYVLQVFEKFIIIVVICHVFDEFAFVPVLAEAAHFKALPTVAYNRYSPSKHIALNPSLEF